MAKTTCVICGAREMARGWCSKHYSRWKRHGDPLWKPPELTLFELLKFTCITPLEAARPMVKLTRSILRILNIGPNFARLIRGF